ncbi:hypothetical protein [Alicyclobacillus dauci]|uniref:Uncharacterized protein n=1 Tax=Alicyclobacillus dauci TaxID=1475485 RepID=A0ABY6Z444_9BACL|nr:hypothetical protein [Alicyclobacillus dauci]WAH37654.1 hypothetical protein NZD86_03750 [Alicyclobacillus dauci]
MGLFDRIRAAVNGDRTCPPEHLESYKRLANEVYGVEVELADTKSPRSRAYLQAAKCFQVMGEALLRDAFPGSSGADTAVPMVTHEQAEVWYEQIPDLLIAARQEAAFAGSAKLPLPHRIGRRIEAGRACPTSHLAGMRRAADAIETLLEDDLRHARLEGETYKQPILLYEEARTRRQMGDAIVGTIMDGQHVPVVSHEEAEDHYWQALSNYVLIAQGLADPTLLDQRPAVHTQYQRTKLDSNDPWRVTSKIAIQEIREAGEWWQAERDLREHWDLHRITPEEREYEATVEYLVSVGNIVEEGYWFCCPFSSVYRVVRGPVYIIGRTISQGYVFTWDYGDDGAPGRFICESSFERANGREYCDD